MWAIRRLCRFCFPGDASIQDILRLDLRVLVEVAGKVRNHVVPQTTPVTGNCFPSRRMTHLPMTIKYPEEVSSMAVQGQTNPNQLNFFLPTHSKSKEKFRDTRMRCDKMTTATVCIPML